MSSQLLRQAASQGAWIVSGHDPIKMNRYAPISDHIVDLTKLLM